MEEKIITELISELRGEFQIPPYFADKSLTNYILEGDGKFKTLVDEVNYDEDKTARSLLKNYVNYAYFKRLDEFFENYRDQILSWQLSQVPTNANTNI